MKPIYSFQLIKHGQLMSLLDQTLMLNKLNKAAKVNRWRVIGIRANADLSKQGIREIVTIQDLKTGVNVSFYYRISAEAYTFDILQTQLFVMGLIEYWRERHIEDPRLSLDMDLAHLPACMSIWKSVLGAFEKSYEFQNS